MESKNNFLVIRPGINSTFQDLGRHNLNHIGIPISGVMDNRNYLLANSILGNNKKKPVIEFAYQGPLLKYTGENIKFTISGDVIFKIIKGKSKKKIEGNCYETYELENEDQLDIISTNRSVYGYLALSGDFEIKSQWGSHSINTKANIGSNEGIKLQPNQILNISNIQLNKSKKKLEYLNSRIEKIRVIKGTNYNFFSEKGKKIFFEKEFEVTKFTDRMGMRLDGPFIENIVDTNIKSEGLIKGVIQIPSDGKPIIMLSDHGTIGGYPKFGVVISADYDKLVQLPVGSKIKFKEVNLSDAETLFKFYNMETQNLISQIR